jgi:hypothetical protein
MVSRYRNEGIGANRTRIMIRESMNPQEKEKMIRGKRCNISMIGAISIMVKTILEMMIVAYHIAHVQKRLHRMW